LLWLAHRLVECNVYWTVSLKFVPEDGMQPVRMCVITHLRTAVSGGGEGPALLISLFLKGRGDPSLGQSDRGFRHHNTTLDTLGVIGWMEEEVDEIAACLSTVSNSVQLSSQDCKTPRLACA
jgi:hypothetical protein